MSKLKKIIAICGLVLTAVVTTILVATGTNSKKANAEYSQDPSKLNIWFEIYAKDDYDGYTTATNHWSGWNDDLEDYIGEAGDSRTVKNAAKAAIVSNSLGYSEFNSRSDVDTFAANSDGTAWSDPSLSPKNAPSGTSFASYYGVANFEDMFDSNGKLLNGPVKPAETTEFIQGDDVVVLAYGKGTNTYSAVFAISQTFKNSNGDELFTGANPYTGTRLAGYFDETGRTSVSNAFYDSVTTDYYVSLGGSFGSNLNGAVSDEILLGGISFKIKSDAANGDYPIEAKNVANTTWILTGASTTYDYSTAAGRTHFNIQSDKKITIAGATDDVDLKSVTVGTNGALKEETDNTKWVNVGTATTGTETWVVDYDQTDSTKQFKYIGASQSGVDIKPSIDGNIYKMVVAKKPEDLPDNIDVINTAKAAYISKNSAGAYTIPGSAITLSRGEAAYVLIAIDPTSGDTTKRQQYVLVIPKEPNHDASLTGVSIGSVTSASVPSFTASLTPTFSSGTTNYTIKVPADTTGISYTATWTSTLGIKANRVGETNDLTNGTADSFTFSSLSSFSIYTTAQDGETHKTYTFTFQALSNDKSVNISAPGYTVSPDGTNTYKIDNVPYAKNAITFTASNTNGATINIGTGTTNVNGVAQNQTLNTNGTAATTTPVTIKVTSESGSIATYTLNINRVAANTNNDATFQVYNNAGDLITGSMSGTTWTASSDLDIFTSNGTTNTTGFYIVPVAASAANGLSKMKFNGVVVNSGSNSSTVSFGTSTARVSKSVSLVVTSEAGVDKTYTINVARRAYDTDLGYTYTIVDDKGNDITSKFSGSTTITNNGNNLTTAVSYVNVTFVPTKATTKIKIGGVDYSNTPYMISLTHTTSPGVHGMAIVSVESEAAAIDSTAKASIDVKVECDALSTNALLDEVTITGTVDTTATKTFSSIPATTDTFEFEIDKDTNGNFYYLALTPKNSNAKIYYSQVGPNDAGTLYSGAPQLEIGKITYVRVVAEDGVTKQNYTVNVTFTDKRDKDPDITDIKVYQTDYKGNRTQITTFAFNDATPIQNGITVPYTVTQLEFEVTFKKTTSSLTSSSSATIQNILTLVGNATYEFEGQAENPAYTSTRYQIPVTRNDGSNDNYITSIKFNGTTASDFNSGNANYAYLNGRNNQSVNVDITVSTGARYTATYNTSQSQSAFTMNGLSAGSYKIITVSVESEKAIVGATGVSNVYNIYIFNADDSLNIDDIQILEVDDTGSDLADVNGATYTFAAGTTNNPFTIAYSAENPYLKVTHDSSPYLDITGDGAVALAKSTTANTTVTRNVVILSEYGKLLDNAGFVVPTSAKKTYTYKFTRNKASSENGLDELSFAFDSGNASKDATYTTELVSTRTFKFEQLGNNPSVTITYKKKDATAKVTGLSVVDPMATNKTGSTFESFTFLQNEKQTINLVVTAEDGTSSITYALIFAQSNAVLDTNADAANITLEGDATTSDVLGFQATKDTYTPTLRANNTKARLTVTRASNASSVEIDGSAHNTANVYEKALDPSGTTVITVVITAQDGVTKKTYLITITTPQADTDNTLSGLKHSYDSVNEGIPGFSPTKTDYTVYVKHTTTTYVLTPTIASANATLVSNNAASADGGLTLVDGENNAVVVVKAENGITKTYTVKVVRDYSLDVDSIEIFDSNNVDLLIDNNVSKFDKDTFTYTLADIPYAEKDLNVVVNTAAGNNVTTTITGNTNLVAGQNNQIVVTVKATSGASVEYRFNVKRTAGRNGNSIETYNTNVSTGDPELDAKYNRSLEPAELASTTINYVVPRSISNFDPQFTVSDGATYEWKTNMDLVPGSKNVKTLVVKSETGIEKTYTINVYTAEEVKEIFNIELLESENGAAIKDKTEATLVYDPTKHAYEMTIPYKYNAAYIKVTVNGVFEKVYINNVEHDGVAIQPAVGTTTYQIYAKSEYGVLSGSADGKSDIYAITIKREAASTDARLKELKVTANGTVQPFTVEFNPDLYTYTIFNLGSTTTSVIIAASPMVSTTQVIGTGSKQFPIAEGYTTIFDVVATAEDGVTTKTYQITLQRGAVSLDDDNNINYITVIDSKGTQHITSSYVWNSTRTASITVPYTASSVTISADKLNASKSDVYFTEQGAVVHYSKTQLSYQVLVNSSMIGSTYVYTVYAISQNGTKGDVYTINMTFTAPSTDATLSSLKVDGVSVTYVDDLGQTRTFNPDVLSYDYGKVNYNRETVYVTYEKSDPNAVVTGDTGTIALVAGAAARTLLINVKAEDGTVKTYSILISRSEPDPYLIDLNVTNYKLLNNQLQEVQFNKDVKSYRVVVPFATNNVTFRASYDNVNYNPTVNNANLSASTALSREFTTTQLEVGENVFTIVVASTTTTTTYNLVIDRLDSKSADTSVVSINVSEVQKIIDVADPSKVTEKSAAVGSDRYVFDASEIEYKFAVSNKITRLDFNITVGNPATAGEPGAIANVYNNDRLRAGTNYVLIQVTAVDGTSRFIVYEVERAPMVFEVDKEAVENNTLVAVSEKEHKYTLDLGHRKASSISDDEYKSYIKWNKDDCDLSVSILSDITAEDCNEVVLSVTDGIDTEFVIIDLLIAHSSQGGLLSFKDAGNWILWLILLIAIALLIVILVSVNKDKYGVINKNRKKEAR